MFIRSLSLLTLLLAVAVVAGCKKGEARVPVVPVTGKVEAFQGQIPVGAFVTLRRLDGSGPVDVAPSGTVAADGTFKIGTYEKEDGAPPGEYTVTVAWFKVTPEGSPGENVLPPKFGEAGSSPIKVAVNGPTEIPAISFK
jgi:hypothetical protein